MFCHFYRDLVRDSSGFLKHFLGSFKGYFKNIFKGFLGDFRPFLEGSGEGFLEHFLGSYGGFKGIFRLYPAIYFIGGLKVGFL